MKTTLLAVVLGLCLWSVSAWAVPLREGNVRGKAEREYSTRARRAELSFRSHRADDSRKRERDAVPDRRPDRPPDRRPERPPDRRPDEYPTARPIPEPSAWILFGVGALVAGHALRRAERARAARRELAVDQGERHAE